MSTTVLYSSRKKMMLRSFMFLAFVLFAVVLRNELPPIIFWLTVLGSGLCIANSSWLLFRPYRLLLDDAGLTVTGGFRRSPKIMRWQDVSAFTFHRGLWSGSSILVTFNPGVVPGWWWGPVAELPLGWQRSDEEMADYLNDWRLSAMKQQAKSA